MRLGRLGIKLDYLAKTFESLLGPAETGLNHTPRCERPHIARFNPHGVLQCLLGFLKTSLARQNEPKVYQRLPVTRVVFDRLPEQLLRFLGFALLPVDDAAVALSFGVLRVERDRGLKSLFGLGRLACMQ